MRLFIGIEIEDQVKKQLTEAQKTLKTFASHGNFTHEDNFHLTLFFIGEVSGDDLPLWENILRNSARQAKPFTLQLQKVQSFARNKRHIVYLGVKRNQSLIALWESLMKELKQNGIKVQDTSYTPHITLAREVELTSPLADVTNALDNLRLSSNVKDIILYESKRIGGVLTYVPLKREKLA